MSQLDPDIAALIQIERDRALQAEAEANRWARRNRLLQARLDTIHDVANGRRDSELVNRCGSEDDDENSYHAARLERERDEARRVAVALFEHGRFDASCNHDEYEAARDKARDYKEAFASGEEGAGT